MSCKHEHCDGHDHEELERGQEYTIYQVVDTSKVVCLNEAEEGSIQKVFKPWDERQSLFPYAESDADEELLIYIPFSASVTLKAINIVGGGGGKHPAKLMAYADLPPTYDFSSIGEAKCTQQWDLPENYSGDYAVMTIISKFTGISSITFYINQNYGDDITRIQYIGMKGSHQILSRKAVIAQYEAASTTTGFKTSTQQSNYATQ